MLPPCLAVPIDNMPASNMLPLVTHHRLRRILRYGPYVLLLPTVALQVAGVDTSANFLILIAGACWLGFSLLIWVSAHVISVAPTVAGTILVILAIVRLGLT